MLVVITMIGLLMEEHKIKLPCQEQELAKNGLTQVMPIDGSYPQGWYPAPELGGTNPYRR